MGVVVPLRPEYDKPEFHEAECSCGAEDRQDCYCFDRNGNPWALIAVLVAGASFWSLIARLVL